MLTGRPYFHTCTHLLKAQKGYHLFQHHFCNRSTMHTFPKVIVTVPFLLLMGYAVAEEASESSTIKSSPGPVDKVAHAVKHGASAAATGSAAHRVADKIGGTESAKPPASVQVIDK